jgi:hypothetical protein
MTIRHRCGAVCVIALFAIGANATARGESAAARAKMEPLHREFLSAHCVRCHNDSDKNGGVRLDDLPLEMADIATAERWQRVLGVLNSGEMPPEDEPQPANDAKEKFLEVLSKQMVVARKALADSGGVTVMRRLNRREYVNTIRDLLDVDVDPADLPADDNGNEFDTIGAGLFFSSDQFEQYLKLGRMALDSALVTGERPQRQVVRKEPEEAVNKEKRAEIARDSEKMNRIATWRRSGKSAAEFGFKFTDEEEARTAEGQTRGAVLKAQNYLNDPATATGWFVTPWPWPVMVELPGKAPPGRYVLRVRLGYPDETMTERKFIEWGVPPGGKWGATLDLLGCREVTGTIEKPEIIELPIVVSKVNTRFGIRDRQHNSSDGVEIQNWWGQKYQTGENGFWRGLWVDWVEWEGPYVNEWPPRAVNRVLTGIDLAADPGEEQARGVIERFAERAFRGRPVRKEFVDGLMAQYAKRRGKGESFLDAIKTPLSIVLASPAFLYVVEPMAGDTPADGKIAASRVPLSDTELANRLAYFLWSSPPDDVLLSYAAAGQLRTQIGKQADRLLNDQKSMQFIAGFAHQWLHMVRLDFFQFNPRLYPTFDASARDAARREVYETIDHVLRKDLPLGTLLKSDTVVVNDVMADYYGIMGVIGGTYRPVKAPEGMPRGGILSMAAILAMGSDGERSSPVERGAWVLRKLLHDPPPPAPANVPMLSRFAGKLMPARELMTAHQEQPQCAQCHRKIDPIGYALEHFDAAGKWRDEEYTDYYTFWKAIKAKATFPIDARGQLTDGTQFDGFEGLRDAVAKHEADFARGFTEHLLEYALGRPLSFSDEELIAKILHAAKPKGYTPRAIIQGIVTSDDFQSKRVVTEVK